MFCVFCNNQNTEVIETRLSDDGRSVRRRRSCLKCAKRFTTYEKVEELPILVIKKDGRRERFNRGKLINGLIRACEKTTVEAQQIEKIVDEIEKELKQKDNIEVESAIIGKRAAKKLKNIDKIAYIRFSSVFQRFVDLEDFSCELNKLK